MIGIERIQLDHPVIPGMSCILDRVSSWQIGDGRGLRNDTSCRKRHLDVDKPLRRA